MKKANRILSIVTVILGFITNLFAQSDAGKIDPTVDNWVLAGSRRIVDIDDFIAKFKSLSVGVNTTDDVLRLLGKPSDDIHEGSTETWDYICNHAGISVSASIQFNSLGKVSWIGVGKMKNLVSETLYSKGIRQSSNVVLPQSSEPVETNIAYYIKTNSNEPANPKPGQIYFNSTDSHFYGWNGKEWLQLDNPKTNP
jgi:hypothetical protein